MGITKLSLNRLEKHDCLKSGSLMLELGAQNMYDTEHYGMIAGEYFASVDVFHDSIDIIEHQGATQADLREDLKFPGNCDVVTDFGTCEHVDGSLYQPYKNIDEACKIGGIMIHENPRTGHWPQHGQHYFTMDFYKALSKACKYELLEVCEEPAMGNHETGMNVCAVLRKTSESKFITELAFNKIYNKYIFKS